MKQKLSEISLFRPFLIVICLVGYHAFAPFGGNWPLPFLCHSEVPVYRCIDKLLYSSMLESFTFISGYVFAFQLYTLRRDYSIISLIKGKFKRLLLPSILFSILYSLLFYDQPLLSWQYVYNVINGVGHLWFLPMLFWCFIFGFIIFKLKIHEESKLIFLFILSVFSIVPLPFQLKETCYYLFFFYLAIYVYQHRDIIETKFTHALYIVPLILLFFVSFITLSPIREGILESSSGSFGGKLFCLSIFKICRIIYSALGLASIYLISLYVAKKNVVIPYYILYINELCMGIYLFHQFILKYLYYSTSEPEVFGVYTYPWLGYLIALLISLLITHLLRKIKFVRSII